MIPINIIVIEVNLLPEHEWWKPNKLLRTILDCSQQIESKAVLELFNSVIQGKYLLLHPDYIIRNKKFSTFQRWKKLPSVLTREVMVTVVSDGGSEPGF